MTIPVRTFLVSSGVILAALALGMVMPHVSPTVALLVAVAAVIGLGLGLLRRMIRPRHGEMVVLESLSWAPTETDTIRFARWLFYAGAATTAFLLIRPVAGFTLSDLFFGAGLVILAADSMARGRRLEIPFPKPVIIGLLIFSTGALLSSFASPLPIQSIFVAVKFVYLFVGWSWLSKAVLSDTRHVETAIRLWLFSAAICGVAGVLQIIAGLTIPGSFNLYGRVSGLTGHVNDLGGVCAVALVAAVAGAFLQPTQKWRLIHIVLAACIGAGLIFSGSVGSMVAAVIGLIILLAMVDRLRSVVVRAVVVAIIATVVWSLVPVESIAVNSPIYRIQQVTGQVGQNSSLDSRTTNYGIAWDAMATNPFVGHGLDEVGRLTSDGDPVHNLYLGCFYESGLLGLVGIVTIIGSLFVWFLTCIGQIEGERRRQAIGLFACFVAFMVVGLSAPTLYQRYGWTPVVLFPAASGYRPASRAGRDLSAGLAANQRRRAISVT